MQNSGYHGPVILLMGATGTGKSTFINLLTSDNNIRVGHDLESQTLDVTTSYYHDPEAGLVALVDTPGFDDSRAGITDIDTLGKIAAYLQENRGRKLYGMVYLHRISDPRLSGQAKKNLKMFKELCGDDNLSHARIVTTYWNRTSKKEGTAHEAALVNGAFTPFIDAGAKVVRHDKELESARSIVSELMHEAPVTLKIQEELNDGKPLGDTSAGAVIIEEMKGLRKKHEKEMAYLRKEIEEAKKTDDHDLRVELAEERRKLEETMASAEQDRKKLEVMKMARAGDGTMGIERTPMMFAQQEVQGKKATSAVVAPQGVPEHGTRAAGGMAGGATQLSEGQLAQQYRPRVQRNWADQEIAGHFSDADWGRLRDGLCYGAWVVIFLLGLLALGFLSGPLRS